MTNDPLTRLRNADPALDLAPEPDEALLRATMAAPRTNAADEPRPAFRSRGRSRRAWQPALAVALLALVIGAALLATGGRAAFDPAAEAYAQTAPTGDGIMYSVVTSTSTQTPPVEGNGVMRFRLEEWHRGRETHSIQTFTGAAMGSNARDDTTVIQEHLTGKDGVLRQVMSSGDYRIVHPSDNEDSANVIKEAQAGFVETFRRKYEDGQLDEAGDTEFAGRPARRYIIKPSRADAARVPPGAENSQAYYIDRETGAPLGYTNTIELSIANEDRKSSTNTVEHYVETVETIKRLPANAENLKRLRTLSLPRRRDAQGCVRGPAMNAKNQDSAPKHDCGGVPGEPVAGYPNH